MRSLLDFAWRIHEALSGRKTKADTAGPVLLGEGKCCDKPPDSERQNIPHILSTASH
jgi:hypothetical protein